MEKQIVEGNNSIAKFIGLKKEEAHTKSGPWYYNTFFIKDGQSFRADVLQYHSSYDWQIEAWQKFYKTVYDFYNDDPPNEFVQLACDYESEISIGTPLTAFQIFVQALKWFNQQPK